jgi:hypothetical protein
MSLSLIKKLNCILRSLFNKQFSEKKEYVVYFFLSQPAIQRLRVNDWIHMNCVMQVSFQGLQAIISGGPLKVIDLFLYHQKVHRK